MNNHSLMKKLIFSTLFFLIAVGSFGLLYFEINHTEGKSDIKLEEWRNEASRREEIKSLNVLMKKIEAEKSLIDSHFAQSTNPVPFLDTLEKLARSVGATNTVSSIELSKDGGSLLVGMSVSGSFEAFYKFLTLLENSPYGLEFISMNLDKEGGEGSTSGIWKAALKVKLLTFVK